jgi:rhamnogalacturonyl hydrolase YesR
MTELLYELPASHPQHARILRGYRTMMTALVHFQTPGGCWRQLIDRPESFDESSGTGMFTFALITGTERGWLERSTFSASARRAWISLAGFVDQRAEITACCEGTNKFDSLDYYLLRKRKTGDLHGQAAFLWAANAALRASIA